MIWRITKVVLGLVVFLVFVVLPLLEIAKPELFINCDQCAEYCEAP